MRKDLEFIEKKVCDQYYENRKECNRLFHIAESDLFQNIYEIIIDPEIINELFTKTAIVITTANKYEKNILHANYYNETQSKIFKIMLQLSPERENEKTTFAYCFEWCGYQVLHIEAQKTGSYTMGGSADIIRFIVDSQLLYPSVIISFGVCFGNYEGDNNIGDVIISRKVYPYFVGSKIRENDYFINDDNIFSVDDTLQAKIDDLSKNNYFNALCCDVFFDYYMTGEAVVSNKRIRDLFLKSVPTNSKILAGEMEGYGLFKECCGHNHKIDCLIIKSICDWGAMKNIDLKFAREYYESKNYNVPQEEIKTIKDRLQSFATDKAYDVLKVLLSCQIFDFSYYKEIMDYIKRCSDNIIHFRCILDYCDTIEKKRKTNQHISRLFVLFAFKCLIKSNKLTYRKNISELQNIDSIINEYFTKE